MNLEGRALTALRRLGVRDGDRVGVACSGGADSVALVHILAGSGLDILVLHVDHGLREDSKEDAGFVRDMAERLGLHAEETAVAVDPADPRGIEAAAREARYGALEDAARSLGLRWVATAHTREDQAETLLLRLMRGGPAAGIAPVRGIFVRPLLGVDRDELRSWLVERDIGWREDPTNEDQSFERNWVRHSVMPVLRARRPGVGRVLARHADAARSDDEALEALAAEVMAGAEVDGAGVYVRAADLGPEAVSVRVVRRALRLVGTDPRWSEIDAILALRPGGHVLSRGASVWRLGGGFAFLREPVPVPDPLDLPSDGALDAESWGLRVRVGTVERTAWRWRCPAPAGGLSLRSRRAGDRVRTRAGSRKVQDVLVDAKVPRPLRGFVPVLVSGEGPLAVVGLTSVPAEAEVVVDAEPLQPTWSKSAPWIPASA